MEGSVLISLNAQDKPDAVEIAKKFAEDGFKILATGDTCRLIEEAGVPVTRVLKQYEGRPNVQDLITNGDIQLIVNSPYITTVTGARAAAEGIGQVKKLGTGQIKSLQEWHELIK